MMAIIVLILGLRPRTRIISHNILGPGNNYYIHLYFSGYCLSISVHCSFVRSFVRLFVRSFVRSFVNLFVHSFVCLFVC